MRTEPRARTLSSRVANEQGGNTLVLFPVAILLVLGLGALAIDSAVIYLAERRLGDLAAAAATDAVGGLDLDTFYDPARDPALDPALGERRARDLAARMGNDRSFEDVTCRIEVDGLTALASCTARVRPLLAPFWPGLDDGMRIRVEEHARLGQRAHSPP